MGYLPNKAIHPGFTIADIIDKEGMTQKDLSERTGLSEKHISQMVNGEVSITVETALLLENALTGSASFWINLEKNYQENNARIERLSLVKKEVPLISKFPYKELAVRGYVEKTNNKEKMVENLWRFFAVNSIFSIENTEAVAYRRKNGVEVKSEAIATWLRCGEIESKKNIVAEYSESKLKSSLNQIKKLSVKEATVFSKEVKEILSDAGVNLIYIPHFKGTGISGAVRWINNYPVIQLSIYNAWADIFWFNLYHEIGHLILHGKKEKFIEFDDKELSTVREKEKEADQFASNHLIPQDEYIKFLQERPSRQGVINFANKLGIHSGIVAGRLCFDKKAKWNKVSSLRSRLKFAQ